jgi:hypothetical protein
VTSFLHHNKRKPGHIFLVDRKGATETNVVQVLPESLGTNPFEFALTRRIAERVSGDWAWGLPLTDMQTLPQ